MSKPIQEYTVEEILMVGGGNSAPLIWLLTATDEQLDEYIAKISGNEVLHRAAIAERDKRHFRHLKKPHWSTTPGFIVGFLAMVFAGIAAWPVIREWIQPSPSARTIASSPPPQSNSAPAKPLILRTSLPAIFLNPSTNVSTNSP